MLLVKLVDRRDESRLSKKAGYLLLLKPRRLATVSAVQEDQMTLGASKEVLGYAPNSSLGFLIKLDLR